MSTNKQALREQFEVWAEEAGALPWGHLKKQRTASGNYSVQIYTYMWKSWSACHEALLDELEAAQTQIVALQQKCEIDPRTHEIIDLKERIAELEARPANPINFKENADADYCRGWAWNEVKKELASEAWTVGDNCTFYGFFCWGWDSRRQFNEQRAAGITVKGE